MGKSKQPIIGVSNSILKIKELINHVAATGLNILITGETGVGKDLIAHNLYTSSPRADNNFIKVNCAALPETLLESELYGFEKGAFTGAHKNRSGKFKAADKGVLFLDEIGDMTLSLQSKMLHVLQTGEFSPLGSNQEFKTDVWVIAATNHQLEKKILDKEFREDLYYRLNIIKIDVPPLRERPEDIPPLFEYFFKKYSSKYSENKVEKPSRQIFEKFLKYPWPGNIRELQNCIKKQMVLNDWDKVLNELINHSTTTNNTTNGFNNKADYNSDTTSSFLSEFLPFSTGSGNIIEEISLKKIKKQACDKIEREVISYVLSKVAWNRSKASKILKISYKTLLYKINELEISPHI
ncbi:MAG: sigma-54-dependent Fis family transcriptional regulator [Desulfobacteraceae bacterium]|nr:sigma-54-dependent Fis family transcriptional regulator [Desulfobacteraceae bacterium]